MSFGSSEAGTEASQTNVAVGTGQTLENQASDAQAPVFTIGSAQGRTNLGVRFNYIGLQSDDFADIISGVVANENQTSLQQTQTIAGIADQAFASLDSIAGRVGNIAETNTGTSTEQGRLADELVKSLPLLAGLIAAVAIAWAFFRR